MNKTDLLTAAENLDEVVEELYHIPGVRSANVPPAGTGIMANRRTVEIQMKFLPEGDYPGFLGLFPDAEVTPSHLGDMDYRVYTPDVMYWSYSSEYIREKWEEMKNVSV